MIYFLWPTNYAIEITFDSNIIKTILVEPHSEVYIDYTHSVARTNVRDVIIMNEDTKLKLTRTEYSSFGAGLPTDNYGTFEHKDGLYINDGINKLFDEIPLRVGTIANHKVTFESGKEVILADYIEPGNLVILKPRKISRLKSF